MTFLRYCRPYFVGYRYYTGGKIDLEGKITWFYRDIPASYFWKRHILVIRFGWERSGLQFSFNGRYVCLFWKPVCDGWYDADRQWHDSNRFQFLTYKVLHYPS